MNRKIADVYGNRVRVRICGLCWHGDLLLMANHRHITDGDFWAPPGGGLDFGESVTDRLRKEFLEETGLTIAPGRFLFACEFIQKPLHAVELFFEVAREEGILTTGDDPEMPLIREVRYMTSQEIAALPPASLHGIFRLVQSPEQLKTLTGFFRI